MMKEPLRALPPGILLMLAIVFSLGAGSPVSAQSHEWTQMNPGANTPGTVSLEQQCLRTRSASGWTSADCSRLRHLAESGSCQTISVRDGQRYVALTGSSGVARNTTKRLGESTSAKLCVVAPGKVAHWYTEFEDACNNLGILPAPQMTLTPTQVINSSGPQILSLGGITYELGCCCDPTSYTTPSMTIVIPGTKIQSGTSWLED